MELIYVAGAYRGENKFVVIHNVNLAKKAATRLWKEGYAVICPHANSDFMDGVLPARTFLDGGLKMVEVSDVIYMLRGWEESEGSREEHELAKSLGKEIIYE